MSINSAQTLDLALKHHQAGNLHQAELLYRQILQSDPRNADAIHLLGLIARQAGRADVAIDYIQQAIRLRPHFPEAHNNLGNALKGQGKIEEAIAHYRQALRLNPNYAEAHNNLGNALKDQGKLDEAASSYRQALRLKPDYAGAHNNLGSALQDQGKVEEAIACYRQALRLNANFVEAHNNLGSALQDQGKVEEAMACYRQTLRLKPDYAQAHHNLGNVLLDQGKLEEAEASLREALRLHPGLANALCGLGNIHELRGDFAQAESFQRQALQHDPGLTYAWGKLAGLLRGKLAEDDLSAMRRLAASANLTDEQRATVQFGLAAVLDARESYDEAAEQLRQANACELRDRQRRHASYDPELHRWWIDQACATFTPAYFDRVRGFGIDSERPVFIVGLPRSGTTLTEQVLASHSQAHGAGELRLADNGFITLTGGDPSYFARDPQAFERAAHVDAGTVQRLAQRHLQGLSQLNQAAVRVVDKMFDNYMHLGFLATMFPRAKFIHCRRDLRDVAVSCWMTHFRQIPWSNDFDHIASRFKEYERIMEHWRKVLPVPVLEVWYEETVADLEAVARRLTAWCGLEWEPGCLKFYEGKRQVHTASMTQVRQPIYTRSAGRWRNYEKTLGPLFAKLPTQETAPLASINS